MRWMLFPPVFSAFLLIPTAIFHDREFAEQIPSVIWGGTIAAYLCLCCLSAFFISRDDSQHSSGIAFLSQGILLMVISLRAGIPLLSWIGLVCFVIGLAVAFFNATNRPVKETAETPAETEATNENVRERVDSLLSKLDLPMCATDAKGLVITLNQKFCEASGISAEDAIGEVISEILPIDQETVAFASGKWWISQVKEGARYYFSLLPTPDCKPAPVAAPVPEQKGIAIFDPETGLCVEEYRLIRGPQEITRSQRYKRSVTGILLELLFYPAPEVTLTDNQQHMMFVAFASRVKQALRIPDCGFLLPGNRIQIILPETPSAGAKTLLTRLATLPQDVFDDSIREAARPKVKAGIFFYNGTTKMEYGIFSAALEEEFLKSKDASPASEAA
ncbi:MAG: cell wall metabolism sensor histidine kinase WalK [Synergistaceae bacterium]|nr:cell wall metabolism sensor histidine kinase WalK [Synergistaceae bacterium]